MPGVVPEHKGISASVTTARRRIPTRRARIVRALGDLTDHGLRIGNGE